MILFLNRENIKKSDFKIKIAISDSSRTINYHPRDRKIDILFYVYILKIQ